MGIIVERTMGCRLKKFLNWLPAASDYRLFETCHQNSEIVFRFTDNDLLINTQQMFPRQIALMRLPVLQVIFYFGES